MVSSRIEVSLYMYVCMSVCEEMSCWGENKSLCIFFSILDLVSWPESRSGSYSHMQDNIWAELASFILFFWRFTGISTTLPQLCRSSSTLFQGNSRLMEARWSLPAFPLTRSAWLTVSCGDESELSSPESGNVAIQEQQLLFLATKEREHFHSPETALNWNVWICALMCVWLFSLLICG